MSKNTNLSFLTDYITADITNGRIGINTPSPTYSFDVTGIARTSTSTYLATASGNVGIGTTSPSSLSQFQKFLHIDGGASNNSALCLSGQNTGGQGTIGYDSSILYIDAVGSATGANNTITFNTTSVNSSNLRLERMRVTSAGLVGIGTSAPSNILHIVSSSTSTAGLLVAGGSTIQGDALSGQILLGNTAANRGQIAYGNLTGYVYIENTWANNDGDIRFRTKTSGTAIDAVTIKGSGNVGIGTTAPSAKLQIDTAAVSGLPIGIQLNNPFGFGTINTGTQIAWSQSGQQQGAIIVGQQDINTSAFSWMAFYTNNAGNVTQAMKISSNGSIGAPSGTNIYNASDIRLKKNIITTPYGLDAISALNPIKFNWIDGFEKSEDGKDMLGFIAQEVQEVIPEAVESFGGSVDLNGTKIDNPLRVNEKFIIPVLVKAIQELKAEIETLKNK